MGGTDASGDDNWEGTGQVNLPPPNAFADRNLAIFLLDTSGSMGHLDLDGPRPIDQLYEAVRRYFQSDLQEVEMMHTNGEIAVGLYSGDRVDWLNLLDDRAAHPFYFARYCTSVSKSHFTPGGNTPTVTAIAEALRVLSQRKETLRSEGYNIEYRPHIFLLTDGGSSQPPAEGARLRAEAEAGKHCHFFGLCTSKNPVHQKQILEISGENGAYLIDGVQSIYNFFQVASASMDLDDGEMTSDQLKEKVREDIVHDPDMNGVKPLFKKAR